MATTHTDTNVNQLVINKLTKQEYDNLSQVSYTELYLVEEQVDNVVTQNSTNPVQSGAVYEALQDIGGNINDGTTTFTKNNETIGTTNANQENDKTIAIPNDVEMVYFAHSKALSVQTTDAYYDTNYNYLVEENPATWTDPNPQHRITTDGYYYDLSTGNIYQVDNYETTEVTSNVTIQGDIHKLYVDKNTNKAYRWDGGNFILLYENEKEIVDNLIIAKADTNDWYAYPLEGTYIGWITNSTTPASFWDKQAGSLHTFTSEDSGKYFYDTIDNKVYVYISHNNSLYCCSDDGSLYHLENLDTTKTYLSYKTDKLYRTNNGENFNLIATTDYIDLKNKPLSVENSKVKYTLSDGTTKLTLVQESNVKDIPITFTPDTSSVRANIQSGDTIAQMAKIVNSNFGFTYIENSNFELTSYVTDANLYGCFFSGLGILIINGWFRLITTDIPVHSNILRFKGYTPIPAYPRFIDEYSNNIMTFRVGESGKGEWWILNYRSSTNNIYWEGLPTIVVVYKMT